MIERYRDAKWNKLIEAESYVLLSRWSMIAAGSFPENWHKERKEVIYDYLINHEDDHEEEIIDEDYSLHVAVDEGMRGKDFFGRYTVLMTNIEEKRRDGLSTALGKRSVLKRKCSLSDMAPKLGLFGDSYLKSGDSNTSPGQRTMRRRWITGGRSVIAYSAGAITEEVSSSELSEVTAATGGITFPTSTPPIFSTRRVRDKFRERSGTALMKIPVSKENGIKENNTGSTLMEHSGKVSGESQKRLTGRRCNMYGIVTSVYPFKGNAKGVTGSRTASGMQGFTVDKYLVRAKSKGKLSTFNNSDF